MTDLERENAVLRGGLILAAREIQKLQFGQKDSAVLQEVRESVARRQAKRIEPGEERAYLGVGMISFIFKPKKFASVVAYLAARRPDITKKELCKIIYFSDKEHLLRYGRTITGDRYYALEQGPIPTRGLNAINASKKCPDDDAAVAEYGQLRGWIFEWNGRPADVKALSKSDVKILDEVFGRIGHLPAWQLEALSHKESAWMKATQNGPMDFELFFEGSPDAQTIKEILLEESAA